MSTETKRKTGRDTEREGTDRASETEAKTENQIALKTQNERQTLGQRRILMERWMESKRDGESTHTKRWGEGDEIQSGDRCMETETEMRDQDGQR